MTAPLAKSFEEKRAIVEKCEDLRTSKGYNSIKQACDELGVSRDTYFKYKKDLENLYKSIEIGDNGDKSIVSTNITANIGRVSKGRPRKGEMKKKQITINLEPKFIDILKKEADDEGAPFRTHAASYIIKGLKAKYSDL